MQEEKGEVMHKVTIASHRPPVGGFLSYQEAYLFASNNITVKPGQDKEKVIKSSITDYQKTRLVPARKALA